MSGRESAPVEAVRRRRRHAWVAVAAMVLGTAIVLSFTALGWSMVAVDRPMRVSVSTAELPSAERVRVELRGGGVTLRFAGDAPEARLEVRSSGADEAAGLRLDSEHGVLVVRETPEPAPGAWFALGHADATLTLPASLEGVVGIEVAVGSGHLEVEGAAGSLTGTVDTGGLTASRHIDRVDLVVGSGTLDLSGATEARIRSSSAAVWLGGAYERLSVEADSGWVDADVDVLLEFELRVASGVARARLSGSMPATITA